MVFDLSVVIAGLMAVGNMAGWVLLEKCGRRQLIIYGKHSTPGYESLHSYLVLWSRHLGLHCSLLIIGVLAQFLNTSTSIVLAQAAFMDIWACAYQGSLGAGGYTMVSEVPTSSLRGPTQAMATIVSGTSFGTWALVLPFMINPDEANMGGNVAFVFFGFSVPSLICMFFFYPETKVCNQARRVPDLRR